MYALNEIIVRFEDLSARERAQVTETYLCIREHEENRARNKTTKEYPEPIDPSGVKNCTLYKDLDSGYVYPLI